MKRLALIAARSTPTGDALSRVEFPGLRVEQMTPERALEELRAGDIALGRFDVRPTIDGVDDGVWVLGVLEARGVTVLNSAAALLASHDKLLTARLLRLAGLPHPRTREVVAGRTRLDTPVVVKPRFGSWGRDVVRCADDESLVEAIADATRKPWFASSGAIVQELVPPQGHDLRVLVAHDRCVGAITRVAPPGEWRTNVSLGARRVPVEAPERAVELALAAARALDATLVGVDLLPIADGDWVIIEVNGAVEFTRAYGSGTDVFSDVVAALADASDAHQAALPSTLDAV